MLEARSLWPVFLCALGYLLQWPIAGADEEVKDLLNEAHRRYEKQLEEVERDAFVKLDELIDRYSDEGKLDKVLELRAERTRLLEDRAWPEAIGFRSVREKIRATRVRAKRELASAYEDAIAQLTKERRYDDAVALRDELDELKKLQAEFDFRSAEPKQKKRSNASDDRQAKREEADPPQKAPERQSEPPAMPTKTGESPESKPATADVRPPAAPAMPAKGSESEPSVAEILPSAAPAMLAKSGAGERASKDKPLAAILAERAATIPLDDPLATSGEKKQGLDQLVKEVYTQVPPRLWTPQQFDEFAEFFVAAAIKADTTRCSLPMAVPNADPSTWQIAPAARGVSGSVDHVRKFAGTYPGVQWLLTSPSPEDFISRAMHLQAKKCWPEIDGETGVDSLKLWLKSIGCKDAERCRSVLGRIKQAGVRLAALDAMRAELGE